MAISANTLFHFTEKDHLKKILKDYFFPKYSLENISHATPENSIYGSSYIPMVCFCDLLFSQIKDHVEFYGYYGIGLRKKEWGLKKGISPIVYVPDKSISGAYIQSIAETVNTKFSDNVDFSGINKQLLDFYKYIKPYNGEAFNRGQKKMQKMIFYNEREWRFVPKKFRVIAEIEREQEEMNQIIKDYNLEMQTKSQLKFAAKDIKYIIVKNENEIPEFVDFIERELEPTFKDEKERKLLVAKLISVQQIGEDI